MRRTTIGNPPAGDAARIEWMIKALNEINNATFEDDVKLIAAAYTVTNFTTSRTLDGATATLADLINIFGTLVMDLRAGQVKKG